MLQPGTVAPDFTLSDKDGHPVSLSDLRGRRVVLYFYPKDNTPGCTRQACGFAASYAASAIPLFDGISDGIKIIVLTVVISLAAALLFPVKEEAKHDA